MQLEINDNRLKKIINDPNKLIKKVGLEMAKKMHQRFNELKNYRLIVEPLIDGLDVESLHECKKIEIKGVMDYHDGKYVWLIP